ncbi:aromatic ring-hydroxylating dioxygenase subunit alpha [Actinomadura sp. HBU206391]|uniref:aromatic ring-hydroxylating dioxygenase subunit alpha n=1 Tax=Actinomadura sp. HBU206391 TaxID=2731692 RepID=UPI0016502DEB|nr:aromatic ring-hydroxylating dioxygenase subunit alpha [Actinomadura sp. HBU206391]MBC6462346.1 aromatic ring-hydroxylating dioxygenase subunit alpha [Actinomadura sp. HBU206391]
MASFTEKFARNQWYVAAYGREVGRELLARTICGEPIVFYRTEDGRPVALADRCVHRRFPLSKSNLDGDRIVCGYHGFTYDTGGTCVSVPGQKRIPRTARVPSYPVVEQDSFVWVWIGEADRADATEIPRAPWLDQEGWTAIDGMEYLPARYGLLVDNLLDLSHETYLHAGYIGTPEVAETPITTEVDDDASVVHVSRRMSDVECPPFYARSTGIEGRIDRWQDIEYHPPCLYLLHSRVAPTGVAPGADGDDSGAFHVEVVYAITPETETSTFDFWAVARDFALDDQGVSDFLWESNRTVVLQDVAALAVLEGVIADEAEGYQELSINIDTGGLAARRLLKRMVEADAPDRTGTLR